jgi:hypothetical protein
MLFPKKRKEKERERKKSYRELDEMGKILSYASEFLSLLQLT